MCDIFYSIELHFQMSFICHLKGINEIGKVLMITIFKTYVILKINELFPASMKMKITKKVNFIINLVL